MDKGWWLDSCRHPSLEHARRARERQAQLTKPQGALGRMETLAIELAALQATDQPRAGLEALRRVGGLEIAAMAGAMVAAAQRGTPVLVVSHGGALRMALLQACGLPLAATWALRIGYGTRLRLRVEQTGEGGLWGEVLELVQP